mgnify:CR=1 FL=1
MQASVHAYETHQQASLAAAEAVAAELRRLITERGRAIAIFSGDESQAELLDHLVNAERIEWTRVIGFHAFEFLGADEDSPNSQRKFLFDHLVYKVPMVEFHGLRGEAANPEAVCANYAALLKTRPPDFAVLGIGQGGELAGISPGNCDFHDSATVKVTESAIALTIPILMAYSSLFVIATGQEKRQAIQAAIEGVITETCPASILQTHPSVRWFLDEDAAANLNQII